MSVRKARKVAVGLINKYYGYLPKVREISLVERCYGAELRFVHKNREYTYDGVADVLMVETRFGAELVK